MNNEYETLLEKYERDLVFSKLRTWKIAIDFVAKVYLATGIFPSTEKYGLVSQMRRAVTSVPANIAEGYGRTSLKEKERFL